MRSWRSLTSCAWRSGCDSSSLNRASTSSIAACRRAISGRSIRLRSTMRFTSLPNVDASFAFVSSLASCTALTSIGRGRMELALLFQFPPPPGFATQFGASRTIRSGRCWRTAALRASFCAAFGRAPRSGKASTRARYCLGKAPQVLSASGQSTNRSVLEYEKSCSFHPPASPSLPASYQYFFFKTHRSPSIRPRTAVWSFSSSLKLSKCPMSSMACGSSAWCLRKSDKSLIALPLRKMAIADRTDDFPTLFSPMRTSMSIHSRLAYSIHLKLRISNRTSRIFSPVVRLDTGI